MVTRWDPFRDLMGIQNELNRLFGRTYAGGETGEATTAAWMPAMDIYETNDRYVLAVELPGVDPDGVDLSVEDGTLTIRGERSFYAGVGDDAFHRVERRFGTFGRSVSLPPKADTEKIQASFDRGVLTVEIPKVEEPKPKKITIKAQG